MPLPGSPRFERVATEGFAAILGVEVTWGENSHFSFLPFPNQTYILFA